MKPVWHAMMMPRIEIHSVEIDGLKVLQRKLLEDGRGYFERFFCSEELMTVLAGKFIAQINHTLTKSRYTVRGMHFQYPPNAETKFISCIRGEVFDVAVDVRMGSPTFLKWHGEVLSERNLKSLVIPDGFAHGFQTLSENCELLYLHTALYQPKSEGGLNPLDKKLAIDWPYNVESMSARDSGHPMLDDSQFKGVKL